MTIREAKAAGMRFLAESSPTAALDTDCFLEFILDRPKSFLLAHSDGILTGEQAGALDECLRRRRTGLPVAYITGRKEFFGLDFEVNPSVLIPKPDTELLVEKAAEILAEKIHKRKDSILTVCDMCTGSGCVGISVISALLSSGTGGGILPAFTLADISPAALETAKANARKILGSKENLRIKFVQSNLFASVPGKFDMITANPPYIPAAMTDGLLADGRCEPRLALDGDVTENGERAESGDGLEIIRRLVPQAKNHLAPYGILLMETGEYNAEAAAELAESTGFRNVTVHLDLADQLRLVQASL